MHELSDQFGKIFRARSIYKIREKNFKKFCLGVVEKWSAILLRSFTKLLCLHLRLMHTSSGSDLGKHWIELECRSLAAQSCSPVILHSQQVAIPFRNTPMQ